MYTVDLYRRVRLACHHEKLSQREAALRFGIDRRTVSKILLHSEPPGYRRTKPICRPKLGPFTAWALAALCVGAAYVNHVNCACFLPPPSLPP